MSDGIVLNVLRGEDASKQHEPPQLLTEPMRSVSSAHLVSSLTIMTADSNTNESLLCSMERNADALLFLKLCANYWCTEERLKTADPQLRKWLQCHRLYFLAVRSFLFAMFIVTFSFVFVNIFTHSTVASVALATAVTVDLVSVLPAQYLNQNRMLQPAQLLDASAIDESLRISRYYLALCLVSLVASLIVYTAAAESVAGYFENILLLLVGEFLISLNLVFNMFFLIMDLKVSSLLLDQLFLLHERKQLTMDKFTMVREDIRRRVNKSKWASDFIVAPSLVSIVTILVLVFHTDPGARYLAAAWCIALTKELMFISVAFWYVAKVNGRADMLTETVCTDVVLPPVLSTTSGNMSTADSQAKYYELLIEVHRLSIYTSSLSKPISFTLLFKRVTWEDVIVSATGFVITIVVGLVKSLVPKS